MLVFLARVLMLSNLGGDCDLYESTIGGDTYQIMGMLAINDRLLSHMGMLAICDHRFPFLTHRTQTSMAEKVKMHQRSSPTKLNESVQREEESCTMAGSTLVGKGGGDSGGGRDQLPRDQHHRAGSKCNQNSCRPSQRDAVRTGSTL